MKYLSLAALITGFVFVGSCVYEKINGISHWYHLVGSGLLFLFIVAAIQMMVNTKKKTEKVKFSGIVLLLCLTAVAVYLLM